METEKWTPTYLESQRLVGDVAADKAMHAIFEQHDQETINKAFMALFHNADEIPSEFPQEIRDLLANVAILPPDFDADKAKLGQRVFMANMPQAVLSLLCASLPQCYCLGRGVHGLQMSTGLTKVTHRRVVETTQFVIDVMTPGGFEAESRGLLSSQRLRLFHTSMRYLLGRDPKWDGEAWGVPICQEDLGFTLLTFSLVTLDSFKTLGVELTCEQQEAYLYCWNCVGHIIGIEPEMLTHNVADARVLYERIRERQFLKSTPGIALTAALVDLMKSLVPGTMMDDFPATTIRKLCGDSISDLLEVSPPNWTGLLFSLTKKFSHFAEKDLHDDSTRMAMMAKFSSAVIDGLEWVERGGKRVPFAMPDSLKAEWKVN